MTDKTPANENVWYLLATAYGEAKGLIDRDAKLFEDNRRIWNRWAESRVSKEAWNKIYADRKNGADALEIAARIKKLIPWPDADYEAVEKRFVGAGKTFADIPPAYEVGGNDTVNFDDFEFEKLLDMEGYCLDMRLWARRAVFKGNVIFGGTRICSPSFDEATFHRTAYFNNSELIGGASFEGARFKGEALFNKSKLHTANFSSVQFEKVVRFRNTTFEEKPPNFAYAEFGCDVSFTLDYENWPDVNKLAKKDRGEDAPDEWRDAYRWLANQTDGRKLPEETRFFVRQEFRCRRASERNCIKRILPALYSGSSDYGQSVERPLAWLVLLWLAGALVFGCHFHNGVPASLKPELSYTFWAGFGYSFANLFPLFGFEGAFFDEGLSEALPISLKTLSAAQTILSLPLIFLLGLGIRNRFRLR